MNQFVLKETSSIKRIVSISIGALLFAEIAQTDNVGLFAIGAGVATILIYYTTLRKDRMFEYILVMYMCSLFPSQLGLGGFFPIVATFIGSIHGLSNGRFIELRNRSNIFRGFILLLFLSSVLGWVSFNQSDLRDLVLGILSFIGILSLFYVSGNVILTPIRIVKFIKLNVFLAIYALIASLNTMVKIIPEMVFLPQWAEEWIDTKGLFNAGAGGIIGVSPLNGQHNLLLAVLFFSFYFYSLSGKLFNINKKVLILGIILSVLNVFTAGSKAVFTALVLLVLLVYLLQGKLSINLNFGNKLYQIFGLAIISLGMFYLVSVIGFDYVFNRYEQQIERNEKNTGATFTIDGVLDGTVLNRSSAFKAAFANYSRRNWFIGYGWSTMKYQADAFYGNSVFRKTRGGSSHSQYFSTLFLFGWLGFFALWILHILGIIRSYRFLGQKNYPIENRLFAIASIGMICALMMHGVTADNTWYAGYFASTLIIIGLAYSNITTAKYNKN